MGDPDRDFESLLTWNIQLEILSNAQVIFSWLKHTDFFMPPPPNPQNTGLKKQPTFFASLSLLSPLLGDLLALDLDLDRDLDLNK